MIVVKNISKTFKSGDTLVKAVDDISFRAPDATFASIVGKSGSGKSTVLSLLGGLDQPTSGEITIGDKDITKLHDHALITYRSKQIGFVFQNYNLIPNLTALENVTLPMEFAKMKSRVRKGRAAELLELVGLSGEKHSRKPGRLSGGEQQRVAIARAIANRPELILADEPTGNLDSETGKLIIKLLKDIVKKQNTTLIVVTHDTALAKQADVTFHMRDGRLVE